MTDDTQKGISAWDPAYCVGIAEIDGQHKKLFELTALFYGEILEGSNNDALYTILVQLRQYAEMHFVIEETYFRDHPERSFHQQSHQAFVEKINQFETTYQNWQVNLATDIVVFLRNWLVNHITETDKRFLTSRSHPSASH